MNVAWSKAPISVLLENYPDLTPSDILVYLLLDEIGFTIETTEERRVVTTQRSLAARCSISYTKVKASLRKLEQHGLVTVKTHPKTIILVRNPARQGRLPEAPTADVLGSESGPRSTPLGSESGPRTSPLTMPLIVRDLDLQRTTGNASRSRDGKDLDVPVNFGDFDVEASSASSTKRIKSGIRRSDKPVSDWTSMDLAQEFDDLLHYRWNTMYGEVNVSALAKHFAERRREQAEVTPELILKAIEMFLEKNRDSDIRGVQNLPVWKIFIKGLNADLRFLFDQPSAQALWDNTPVEPLEGTQEPFDGSQVSRIHKSALAEVDALFGARQDPSEDAVLSSPRPGEVTA